MQIILQGDETISAVEMNGHVYKIYPSDVKECADGRRFVNIFGNRPASRKPFDARGLRIASTCGGAVIDNAGIIVGGGK